ncbi:MAG: hypothetical protein NT013_07820 [Planctomycetia bacterium]|nr:hypothetical protein [Planctomycetia bacterium]
MPNDRRESATEVTPPYGLDYSPPDVTDPVFEVCKNSVDIMISHKNFKLTSKERRSSVTGINQSFAEDDAGLSLPLTQAFDEVRSLLGIMK